MATLSERVRGSTAQRRRLSKAAQREIVSHIVLLLFGVVMIYPVLWLIGSSFKPNSEIFRTTTSVIPSTWTLENYLSGWRGFGGVTFTTFFINSFIISGIGTGATVLSSAVVAYGFARMRFRFKNFWFTCMILTLMLPTQVQIIPQYIMFSRLEWINTFLPLLVPRFFGQAFFIFMLIQFIRGIPTELDQAAEIDGAGKIGIFWRIILPLIVPALMTAAIFSFYWSWEDFFGPLLYLNRANLYPVSLALKNFADASGQTNWGAIFAMSVASLVPVFAIFFLFQRYLVQGISTTGLKG